MVQDHQLPRGIAAVHLILQPVCLNRVLCIAVRLTGVAVQNEEVDRSLEEIIITAVSRQREIIKIRLDGARIPIMIA